MTEYWAATSGESAYLVLPVTAEQPKGCATTNGVIVGFLYGPEMNTISCMSRLILGATDLMYICTISNECCALCASSFPNKGHESSVSRSRPSLKRFAEYSLRATTRSRRVCLIKLVWFVPHPFFICSFLHPLFFGQEKKKPKSKRLKFALLRAGIPRWSHDAYPPTSRKKANRQLDVNLKIDHCISINQSQAATV